MEEQKNIPAIESGSISYNWQVYLSKSPEQRLIEQLIKTVNDLKQEVSLIKNDKVLEALHLPEDIAIQSGLVEPKKKRRLKSGWGWRPLLKSEIEDAYKHSETAAGAARYLGVYIDTFKKYAKQLGMWKTNQNVKGVKKPRNPDAGRYPLSEILDGKHPNVPIYRIKEKLFRSGLKKEQCEQCGFCEKRITDGRIPLILNFEDGNSKNHKLENLRVFCYNCTFTSGKGFIHRGDNGYELPPLENEKAYHIPLQ